MTISGDTQGLQALAAVAGDDLDGASALDVVRWAVETLPGPLAVAGSMQDAVLPHLVSQVVPGVDVLFLETGYHFAETLRTREVVERDLDVRVVDVLPRQTVAEQDAEYGARCSPATPARAASCARWRRWPRRWCRTPGGSPASAARRRRPVPAPRSWRGTTCTRW
ncbi:hypothetical protein GCM10025868_26920 [Angustibacter aerolatus]|uniref:Phosphoadenosine phosphosulphate reductase domain-containing protein n=1 Tax=Angustibacter aerolatus TaxID=1162965 RepID=A0ABQ6JI65_9ACTN|nr:phosphoadenosine phosphosulfate reductase family protein [Angustibacter aerolatus]GMA87442.1 hypothetical protein GCM10025868_26920 [Angustibacter aerolatus]